MVRNFSGSINEYTKLVETMRTEKSIALKCDVLNTPSHMRVKKFGREALVKLNINFTERRVYA